MTEPRADVSPTPPPSLEGGPDAVTATSTLVLTGWNLAAARVALEIDGLVVDLDPAHVTDTRVQVPVAALIAALPELAPGLADVALVHRGPTPSGDVRTTEIELELRPLLTAITSACDGAGHAVRVTSTPAFAPSAPVELLLDAADGSANLTLGTARADPTTRRATFALPTEVAPGSAWLVRARTRDVTSDLTEAHGQFTGPLWTHDHPDA